MDVVIGANGYLGSYIVKNILETTSHKILAIGRTIEENMANSRIECMKCDITNIQDIEKLNRKLAAEREVNVVYLAAFHHPDEIKKNPRFSWHINITSLSSVLNCLDNVNCLFYASTEMVYGEGDKNTYFKEEDELHPINIYGIQKRTAEALVLGYGYNVVRFPFLIGPSLLNNREHFYDIILKTLKEGKEIEMFEDTYKTALDFNTSASLVIQLMEKYNNKMPKIINVSGDEVLSKYDIAVRMAQIHNLDAALIKPIRLNAEQRIFKEKRANYTLLDNRLLKHILKREAVIIEL